MDICPCSASHIFPSKSRNICFHLKSSKASSAKSSLYHVHSSAKTRNLPQAFAFLKNVVGGSICKTRCFFIHPSFFALHPLPTHSLHFTLVNHFINLPFTVHMIFSRHTISPFSPASLFFPCSVLLELLSMCCSRPKLETTRAA